MTGSFEKSVKGATKIKLAAPKSKYIEHILIATHAGDAGVAEVFRALQPRLRDPTWTIVFKGLIVVHLMIREGEPDLALKFIAGNPRKVAINNFSDDQVQGQNIRNYSHYLLERAAAYKETKIDYVRAGEGRLKRQSVEKGLLRETESVQKTIEALLACDVVARDVENDVTLTAFTCLVQDLLALFHVMNEGVINILEHFFEMSKFDAERALAIYKSFSRQTDQVVDYLRIARQYEHATRLEVPRVKHAPTSLTSSLEEYVKDPDFDINRRQYLAQQEAKRGRSFTNGANDKPFPVDGSRTATQARSNGTNSTQAASGIQTSVPARSAAKGPAPNLIDFFESIEQNQQPMANELTSQQQQQMSQYQQQAQLQQYQQTGFVAQPQPQPTPQFTGYGQQTDSPFAQAPSPLQAQPQQAPLQQNFTSYGSYTPQTSTYSPQQPPMPGVAQNQPGQFDTNKYMQQPPQQTIQPQATNPFRQSVMPAVTSAPAPAAAPVFSSSVPSNVTGSRQQSTNPFARNVMPQPEPPQQPSSINPNPSGSTNPFARNVSPPTAAPQATFGVGTNPTGGTNPFRQSPFPATQPQTSTWQPGQPTIGGFEQLPTVSVFPRPGNGQPR